MKSRGQALLWSCYVDLAHGIVWANHDYLLEFAGKIFADWHANLARINARGCSRLCDRELCCIARWKRQRRGLPRLDKRTVEDKELRFPDVIHRVGLGDGKQGPHDSILRQSSVAQRAA